jgi:hypothetical protein
LTVAASSGIKKGDLVRCADAANGVATLTAAVSDLAGAAISGNFVGMATHDAPSAGGALEVVLCNDKAEFELNVIHGTWATGVSARTLIGNIYGIQHVNYTTTMAGASNHSADINGERYTTAIPAWAVILSVTGVADGEVVITDAEAPYTNLGKVWCKVIPTKRDPLAAA